MTISLPGKNKFDPQYQLVDRDGRPTQWFRDYMQKLDALVAATSTQVTAQLALNNLTNAANDAAAAVAGVPVGALYRNGSVIQIRVT